MKSSHFFLLCIFSVLLSCQDQQGLPKPRAYPRVEYPERKYQVYSVDSCPFTFQYPVFAEIKPKVEQDCWFDIFIPNFKASIHCSYLRIKDRENLDDLVNDAFLIASRINERANYMEESRVRNENGVDGLILEWTGPAASPLHFYVTDSTKHFFKGALYFDAKVQPDSLAPIASFIREDIHHLISSFKWRE